MSRVPVVNIPPAILIDRRIRQSHVILKFAPAVLFDIRAAVYGHGLSDRGIAWA